MHDWANIINASPLLIFLIIWIAYVIYYRGRQNKVQKLVERELELQGQQLAVLREINETLKQLRESRG
jgi:predicted acyltransferase (DUF342 family)